ncbi:gamma-mobile-trio integrase GmtZ [Noviherbaspirillum pedocola]|uniref:Integrase n=1 Tax=Noviherbaspirillum pedocola TaxID=2801341 RepID=A0A934SSF9_9BURK|nr:VPA1269 family protein [Noviherbaspirillum pedocola]MBK4734630.1 hypothetical protein [Noviherbaspirillum pedocola]
MMKPEAEKLNGNTEMPHPDEYLPILHAKVERKHGHKNLDKLHAVCKAHFNSGRRDFDRGVIVKAAGIHYQTLRKPAYYELVKIWAEYAAQHPIEPQNGSNLGPEEAYLACLSSIRRSEGRETLRKIDEACREHFKEGRRDFTINVLSKKVGISDKVVQAASYRPLIDAWAAYAEEHARRQPADVISTPKAVLANAQSSLRHVKSKETAEQIYKICEAIFKRNEIDFSYSRVARVTGISEEALQATAPYREIIEAWHDAAKRKLHGVTKGDEDPYRTLLDDAIGDGQIQSSTRMKLEHIHELLKSQHKSGIAEFDGIRIARKAKLTVAVLQNGNSRYKKLFDGWEKLTGKSTVFTRTSPTGRLLGTDDNFDYLLRIDPALAPWQKYAKEWMSTLKQTQDGPLKALKYFFFDYIHKQGLATNPEEFFAKGYKAPCFYETCLSHLERRSTVIANYNLVARFVSFVLENFFSVTLPSGARAVPAHYCSPIPALPESVEYTHRGPLDESNKRVLPYRYILMLREILCPESASSFRDWTWAHDAVPLSGTGYGGDWFAVTPDLINKDDPNCVYRTRTDEFGCLVHEIWCPARAVAMFVKLELPLRMYQVRFLDSGEADTYRYEEGKWVVNTGPLAQGSKKEPRRMGFFRSMNSDIDKADMTGLYINTNKNADRGKGKIDRGYEVPWEHKKVLSWSERLRNWQEKYNSIDSCMSWTELDVSFFGSKKSDIQKEGGGESCFLFRNAAATRGDKQKPIKAGPPMKTFWTKLLLELERRLREAGETAPGGAPLTFVEESERGELVPLYTIQGLRVSLITSFALEGGVPLPVLSKCIAGHARLVMTIYYTKAGIRYVTDVMDKASQKMFADAKENWLRWLKDASYKELKSNGAYVDPIAVQAVLAAQGNGASLVRDDKGLCPKGGMGCDSGGIYTNDDTGGVEYGPVPGYPQKNCPRCRWFFTGPAFIDGLQNHWNVIHLHMGDNGKKVKELAEKVSALEDERYECQSKKRLFLEQPELDTLIKAYENAVSLGDKLANDQHATLRLIDRCKAIANEQKETAGLALIGAGDITDVEFAIKECGKLQQVLTAVQISKIYPEHDLSKAVLEAGRAYDMMLAQNEKSPVLFRLSDDEQRIVVQQMTLLLRAYAGSTEGAVEFIEGRRRLSEIGFDFSEKSILELAKAEKPIIITEASKRKLLRWIADEIDEESGNEE